LTPLILNQMELLHKVQTELEKKGYDFSSEFWTDKMLGVLHDAVYATEKVLSGQERAESELRQLFKNNSDCYAATVRFGNDDSSTEVELTRAITEDRFIEIIKMITPLPELPTNE